VSRETSSSDSTTMSASESSSADMVFVTATHFIPADLAARTPLGASSKTMQFARARGGDTHAEPRVLDGLFHQFDDARKGRQRRVGIGEPFDEPLLAQICRLSGLIRCKGFSVTCSGRLDIPCGTLSDTVFEVVPDDIVYLEQRFENVTSYFEIDSFGVGDNAVHIEDQGVHALAPATEYGKNQPANGRSYLPMIRGPSSVTSQGFSDG